MFCPVLCRVVAQFRLAVKPIQDSAYDCQIAKQPGDCTLPNIGSEDERQIPKNAGEEDIASEDAQYPGYVSAEHKQRGLTNLQRTTDG